MRALAAAGLREAASDKDEGEEEVEGWYWYLVEDMKARKQGNGFGRTRGGCG
jgi:hypothetical protein